jgi:ATP-dependent protease Clp ATPase subunit
MKKVIGQDELVGEIRNIIDIFKASEGVIRPHFVLTGPSGSGKSHTVQSLAEQSDLGYLEINAAQLTKEGTSGNSLSKALTPLIQFGGKQVIVFVDEFDKLFISGNSNSSHAHESTTGVQNEFLKVLEGRTTEVYGDYGKYVQANVNNCLFIFAGAFNNEDNINVERLRELGVKTEFLGRVGLVFNTKKLSLEDLFEILDSSELLNDYCNLFENADKEEITLLLKAHIKNHYEMNTLGARYINTLINQYFIRDGQLTEKVVEDSSFHNKLKLGGSKKEEAA